MLFKHGSEAQAALKHQGAHVPTEHNQLVLEGDADMQFIRHNE